MPADNEQLLITASVMVLGVAFRVAGSERHLGRLRSIVADRQTESFAETQMLTQHVIHNFVFIQILASQEVPGLV